MSKKQFSEKTLQEVLAQARVEGKNPRGAAIALFEGMETKGESQQRELSESKPVSTPPVKRRSLPKDKAVKPKTKPKASTKK